MINNGPGLFPGIVTTIRRLQPDGITEERKKTLQPLVAYVRSTVESNKEIRLHFICTHNSRRSHLAQVWAQTLACYFNIKNVYCYSGGTESTAVFPMVTETLQASGFGVKKLSEGQNPVYAINYAPNEHPVIAFSKKLDDDFNPKSEFAAMLTCAQAEDGCPFIAGAEMRMPITYEDPKEFDHTPQQAEKYRERSLQIATELFYVFSQINS